MRRFRAILAGLLAAVPMPTWAEAERQGAPEPAVQPVVPAMADLELEPRSDRCPPRARPSCRGCCCTARATSCWGNGKPPTACWRWRGAGLLGVIGGIGLLAAVGGSEKLAVIYVPLAVSGVGLFGLSFLADVVGRCTGAGPGPNPSFGRALGYARATSACSPRSTRSGTWVSWASHGGSDAWCWKARRRSIPRATTAPTGAFWAGDSGRARTKDDACLQVSAEALRLFSLVEAAASPKLVGAAHTLLAAWRNRRTEKPYMFGHGRRFVDGKWPPTWYDASAVLEALAGYPSVWKGKSAAREDRRSTEELVVALASTFGVDGMITPRSCYQGFEGYSFGQKKKASPWATARSCALLRTFASVMEHMA